MTRHLQFRLLVATVALCVASIAVSVTGTARPVAEMLHLRSRQPPPTRADYEAMIGKDAAWLREHYGQPEHLLRNSGMPGQIWHYDRGLGFRWRAHLTPEGVVDWVSVLEPQQYYVGNYVDPLTGR